MGSASFSYIEGIHTWVCPPGVFQVNFTMYGARGGSSAVSAPPGAILTGTFKSVPGDTYYIEPSQGFGRYSGGANGGTQGLGGPQPGGVGGGAAAIYHGGTALGNRIAVAGGSGGASANAGAAGGSVLDTQSATPNAPSAGSTGGIGQRGGGGGGAGWRGGGGGGGNQGGAPGSSMYHTSYFDTAPTNTPGGNTSNLAQIDLWWDDPKTPLNVAGGFTAVSGSLDGQFAIASVV